MGHTGSSSSPCCPLSPRAGPPSHMRACTEQPITRRRRVWVQVPGQGQAPRHRAPLPGFKIMRAARNDQTRRVLHTLVSGAARRGKVFLQIGVTAWTLCMRMVVVIRCWPVQPGTHHAAVQGPANWHVAYSAAGARVTMTDSDGVAHTRIGAATDTQSVLCTAQTDGCGCRHRDAAPCAPPPPAHTTRAAA